MRLEKLRWLTVSSVLSGVLFFIAHPIGSYAHDLVQPEWRGQDGTTYQEWRFDHNDNPAGPEVIINSYGTASASITIGAFGTGWLDYFPQIGTQQGYWDLGAAGSIVIDIDNQSRRFAYKEIWVQVTYFQDITLPPSISVPGATHVGGQAGLLVEDAGYGAKWLLDQSTWRIESSPSHEQVIVTSSSSGSLIDQIVIDTSCRGCVVYFDDLANLSAQWLAQGVGLEADLNGDKEVNFGDYAILAASWLGQCPPGWPWL
jgi:hypothetical protein